MPHRVRNRILLSALVGILLLAVGGDAVATPPGRNGVIAFNELGSGLRSVRPDGTGLFSYGPGFDPTWSPDGRWLAFLDWGARASTHQIWIMRADGTHARKVTTGAELVEFEPAWSPDGGRIAFSAVPPGMQTRELFTIRLNGNGLRRLTRNSMDDSSPAWSPDGRSLVFARWWNKPPGCPTGRSCAQLWTTGRRGVGERRLFAPPLEEGDPPWTIGGITWSPNGRWVAFAGSDVSYWGEALWRIRSDGSAPLRHIAPGLSDPSWSPDGRRIVAIGRFYEESAEEWFYRIVVVSPDGEDRRVVYRLDQGIDSGMHGLSSPDWQRRPT